MTIDLTDADTYREKRFFVKPADLSMMVEKLFAEDAYSLTIEPLLEAHFTDDAEEATTDETTAEYMITATFGADKTPV